MLMRTDDCPNCGAALQIPPDTEYFRCNACGSDIHTRYGRLSAEMNPAYPHPAQAIVQAEQDAAAERHWWLGMAFWLILSAFLFGLGGSADRISETLRDLLMGLSMLSGFAGPLVFAFLMPRRYAARNSLSKRITAYLLLFLAGWVVIFALGYVFCYILQFAAEVIF